MKIVTSLALHAGLFLSFAQSSLAMDVKTFSEPSESVVQLAQRARSCKAVSSCYEAVVMWCEGYMRADGDNDGIPCENVCTSKEVVDKIREEINC